MDGNVAHHAEQVKPSSKDQLSPVLLLLFGTYTWNDDDDHSNNNNNHNNGT
jgi:hypothetical protein